MEIKRDKDKIQITVSSNLDSFGLQQLIDYIKYLEATSSSTARQYDADELAEEVNEEWWKKNKDRFLK